MVEEFDRAGQHYLFRIERSGTTGTDTLGYAYRIMLSIAGNIVIDTKVSKETFRDSLNADFMQQAELYDIELAGFRPDSLYFDALLGVDQTDWSRRIGCLVTYHGMQRGQLHYWVKRDAADQEGPNT